MIDVFIAAVRFIAGEPAKPWWKYTPERKRTLAARSKGLEDALAAPDGPADGEQGVTMMAHKNSSAPSTEIPADVRPWMIPNKHPT